MFEACEETKEEEPFVALKSADVSYVCSDDKSTYMSSDSFKDTELRMIRKKHILELFVKEVQHNVGKIGLFCWSKL